MIKENMKYEQLNTLFTLAFGSDKLIKYRDVFLKNNLAGISFKELLILSSYTQVEWKRYLFKNYN